MLVLLFNLRTASFAQGLVGFPMDNGLECRVYEYRVDPLLGKVLAPLIFLGVDIKPTLFLNDELYEWLTDQSSSSCTDFCTQLKYAYLSVKASRARLDASDEPYPIAAWSEMELALHNLAIWERAIQALGSPVERLVLNRKHALGPQPIPALANYDPRKYARIRQNLKSGKPSGAFPFRGFARPGFDTF